MNSISYLAFFNELEKIAARAGLKQIKNLLLKPTQEAVSKASRIAKTPGVLKPSAAGSQIKRLGAGNEGLATLIADPQHGVSVRKLYNPQSAIATPKMVGRKMQIAGQIKDPSFAETYGFRRTGKGGRMTFHEYSPNVGTSAVRTPKKPSQVSEAFEFPSMQGGTKIEGMATPATPATRIERTGKINKVTPQQQVVPPQNMEHENLINRAKQLGAEKGWTLADLRSPNISGGKVIDYMPLRPKEYMGQFGNTVGLSSSGLSSTGIKKRLSGNLAPVSEKNLYRLL